MSLVNLTARSIVFGAGAFVAIGVVAQPVPIPNIFVNGTPADANEVNENFKALAAGIEAVSSGTDGPVGPDGPAGAQGPQGDEGPEGPAGGTGQAGPNGPQGATGAAGAQGPQGDEGPEGPVGGTGQAGPDGAQGTMGATGPAGGTGQAGPGGPQGTTGATGPAGGTGQAGPGGPQGATGPAGPAGADAQAISFLFGNEVVLPKEPKGGQTVLIRATDEGTEKLTVQTADKSLIFMHFTGAGMSGKTQYLGLSRGIYLAIFDGKAWNILPFE